MSADEKEMTLEEFIEKAQSESKKPLTQSEKESLTRQWEVEQKQKELDGINAKREGKGTRLQVSQTRGKNPQIIVYEAFDESKPETLPETQAEFMELTKVADQKTIVSLLVEGYNALQYTAASDPIAEYVDKTWDDKVQTQFKMVIRNYANNAKVSIDDAVALIKPGFSAGIAKAKAAEATPAA